jgi:hypothetical protein
LALPFYFFRLDENFFSKMSVSNSVTVFRSDLAAALILAIRDFVMKAPTIVLSGLR